METVEFRDVEVIDETVTGLLCRIDAQQVSTPSLLLQPGTTIGRRGELVFTPTLGRQATRLGTSPESAFILVLA